MYLSPQASKKKHSKFLLIAFKINFNYNVFSFNYAIIWNITCT